jgi:hypothetical protein
MSSSCMFMHAAATGTIYSPPRIGHHVMMPSLDCPKIWVLGLLGVRLLTLSQKLLNPLKVVCFVFGMKSEVAEFCRSNFGF